MRSDQGSRRSGKCRNLTLFASAFPRFSLLVIVPKLDVAGSTPVARSTFSPSRITALRDRASWQTRPDKNSLPVAIAEVGEIDRAADIVEENEFAAQLRGASERSGSMMTLEFS
jgi:hypothetical protein